MTVGELEDRIAAYEVQEWQAHWKLESEDADRREAKQQPVTR